MGKFKNKLELLIAVLTVMLTLIPIHAEEKNEYRLIDFSTGTEAGSFSTYQQAEESYLNQKNNYDNLGIQQESKIIKIEYGVIHFRTNESCDYEITYENALNQSEAKLNGCKGIDAAYIDTDSSASTFRMQISNVIADIKVSDAQLLPYSENEMRLSRYSVVSGQLFHDIKENMVDQNYGRIINIGTSPEYLSEGEHYFSYDGHHFYHDSDYRLMIDDLRLGTFEHSINASFPFYDYYQFLPFRSLSDIDATMVHNYFQNDLHINGKMNHYSDYDQDYISDILTQSQYDGELDAFWQYQYEYGVNAMLMLSISMVESDYGRSLLSYTRNNLFDHAAYDNLEEKENSRYHNLNRSVYAFAKFYLSGGYVSPMRSHYHGGFLGNKASGMNVEYSSDPYWGEEVSSHYRSLSKNVDVSDEFKYQIGINNTMGGIAIYEHPDTSSDILYKTEQANDYAFIILDETSDGKWYEIQLDGTLNDKNVIDLQYEYNFIKSKGYIEKDKISHLLAPNIPNQKEYVKVSFQAEEGQFLNGKRTISYYIEKGRIPYITIPVKEKSLMTGWDKEIDYINQDEEYHAVYQEVSSIHLTSDLKTEYDINDRIDLQNAMLEIIFENGKRKQLPLSTSMLSGFDMSKDGIQEVIVEYAGHRTSYQIKIDQEKSNQRIELKKEILSIINQLKGKKSFLEAETNQVLEIKEKLDQIGPPYLTQQELRDFDNILKLVIGDQVRFVLKDKKYALQLSGIMTSYPLEDAMRRHYLFRDTYRIKMSSHVKSSIRKKLSGVADGLGGKKEFFFQYKIRKNFERLETDGSVLLTIDKPEGYQKTDVYTVLFYDDKTSDVIRCYTRQAEKTISFMAYQEGSYLVISKETANEYTDTNPQETINRNNTSVDVGKWIAVFTVTLVLSILGISYFVLRNKRQKEIIVNLEKMDQNNQIQLPLPPVDVTQALQVLEETLALNVEEVEQELKKEEIDDKQNSQSE